METRESKPIKPNEVGSFKKNVIPSYVIDVFNELISIGLSEKSVTLRQDNIIQMIMERMPEKTKFCMKWLNVEPLYRNAGWKVVYDKPGYNETSQATFKFSF